jgi:hypothetical protein
MPWKLDSEIYQKIDGLVRAGNLGPATALLVKVPIKDVPRADLAPLAALARRAGLPRLALRMLNPIVRPEKGWIEDPATESEKAQYGVALIGVGATPEALRIFESIDTARAPEGLLFHAFGLIGQWRYAEAVPLLDRFLTVRPEPYLGLVGRMNLAASLIYVGNLVRARQILREGTEQAEEQGATRLAGNARELTAQLLIREGELARARAHLKNALALPGASASLDGFFSRKWLAVCDLMESRGSTEALEGMLRIREEAVGRLHWETVRDVDAHLAVRARRAEELAKVYFGTPFPDYRKRLLEDFGPDSELPLEFVWRTQLGLGQRPGEFDLFRGQDLGRSRRGGRGARLKPGLLLGLLRALSSDFYRPLRPATLFSELFPDEFHNPLSSPHRVHEIVLRLRHWFKEEAHLSVGIEQLAGAYRVRTSGSYGIRVRLERSGQSQAAFVLETLRKKLPAVTFTAEAAADVLGLSPRSARRFLSQGAREGLLESLGAHSNRRYSFKRT